MSYSKRNGFKTTTLSKSNIQKQYTAFAAKLGARRHGDTTKEFMEIFIFLVIGLSLVAIINTFASTASVSAFPTSANTATLYGLIPLFVALIFVAALAGVVLMAISKYRHK